jgi:hypothetical protein
MFPVSNKIIVSLGVCLAAKYCSDAKQHDAALQRT